MTEHRPNFLFICFDDLNDAIAGLGGHPQASTPNLDRLCERGVRFVNGQVSVPICGPSRASFLSGLAPWTTGYYGYNFTRDSWWNNAALANQPTFMEHAGANGYGVYGTGKIFHNGQEKQSVWNREYGHLVDWGPWTWDGKKEGKGWSATVPHPSMPFESDAECFFLSLADVPDVPANEVTGAPGYRGWRNGDNTPFRYVSEDDRDLMHDDLNAKWAADVLSRPHENEPFMLCVGIGRPHSPLIAPQKYFDLFPLDEVQLSPQIKAGDRADCSTSFFEGKTATGDWGHQKYLRCVQNGGELTLRRWTQAYLACIAYADACLGQVLDALWDSPHADTTCVFVTSDNGYHMGEKEWLFKNSLWERSNRVPFIAAGPDCAQGATCEQPVSLIDLFPTINEWLQLPTNSGPLSLDGYSFADLARNPDEGQWDGPSVAVSVVSSDVPVNATSRGNSIDQHYSVRSMTHRYLRYANGDEELYDHQTDPYEWHNIADKPHTQDAKEQLKHALSAQVGISFP